ncbi:tyrosine-type recombinase/integrase [Bergeyella zoohelcum]|uniref:tyrosine-type recombinase/integrase n=1 Tax=Bergeyella zoohelcum TaxID=1015 RepID=UPI002A91D84A|nr:tyrosine-type recombinase/integrase [Bergeyella zoohelcum]MDY6026221.1 tyrosine-type recombinase/integrase [Bergeyella zoohelcum]
MIKIDYISKEESILLIEKCKNPKYKCIILLMLDAGLRVSETLSLKLKNFDFQKRTITVRSLKKKNEEYRTIPISDRLYRAIALYLEKSKIPINEADNYLFPSYTAQGYLCRKTVWKVLKSYGKNLGIQNLHPHTLRHTFATHHLNNGTKLEEIKTMLGHSSYDTTLIYSKIPTDELAKKVDSLTTQKLSLWLKLKYKFFPPKKTKLINLNFNKEYFTIGRNEELNRLSINAELGINTLLIGDIGTGKTHLLENLKTSKNILKFEDDRMAKKSLMYMMLHLLKGDKESMLSMLYGDIGIEAVEKKLQRESALYLCDKIKTLVEPKEYILLIDNITDITASAKRIIERLKDTFTIICAARKIKSNETSFLWNFEKIEIKNLNRTHAITFIQNNSTGLQVENWEDFRNHIFEQTNGNPRAMAEMIDRYRKEPFLTLDIVKNIKHSGALPEIDFTFIIVVFLGVITALRYASRELDEPALRMIGSVGLILLIISRPLFKELKRKFV